MKINKLVITIFFSAVGLFVSTALQAQEAKTLFVNMPDSLSPLLTKVNREDCIDFLESKMKAQVENRFGKILAKTISVCKCQLNRPGR